LIYRKKNKKMYKIKVTYFNKKYLKDNVTRTFLIKNYFLNLIL